MHGVFSSPTAKGMIYCAEHSMQTPMGDVVGDSVSLSMTEYTGTNAGQIKDGSLEAGAIKWYNLKKYKARSFTYEIFPRGSSRIMFFISDGS